ncbi:MAG: PilN domain-containing protein [Mariprofundaceae bacterium]|nr:PilN domain-containing protein [Mariprofundaceae bacterium]
MIRINLLPYREDRRKQQVLEHVIVLAVAIVIAITVCVGMQLMASSELDSIQAEQAILTKKNAELVQLLGKTSGLETLREEVQRKLDLVDTLQKGRFRSLELLLTISRLTPNNLWLDSISDKKGKISLTGYAETSVSISEFMSDLENSEAISSVNLGSVETDESAEELPVKSFDLTVMYDLTGTK